MRRKPGSRAVPEYLGRTVSAPWTCEACAYLGKRLGRLTGGWLAGTADVVANAVFEAELGGWVYVALAVRLAEVMDALVDCQIMPGRDGV